MDFIEFQQKTADTAVYPGSGEFMGFAYAALGINGEAGEVAEQVKKAWRNDGEITDERRTKILDEVGDVLWYCAQMCNELKADMNEVAEANLAKLQKRLKRGQLKQR